MKLKPLLRSRLPLVSNFHLKPNTITVKFNNQRIFNSRYRFRFKSQQFYNLPVLVSLFAASSKYLNRKLETTIKTLFFQMGQIVFIENNSYFTVGKHFVVYEMEIFPTVKGLFIPSDFVTVDRRHFWSFWQTLWRAEWVAYPFLPVNVTESLGVNGP